jgi:hypothetical protein
MGYAFMYNGKPLANVKFSNWKKVSGLGMT